MIAAKFEGKGSVKVREAERPRPGPGEAVIRVTTTTICGTDVHIVRGEHVVRPGLILGHEPVGTIDSLGPGVTGFSEGDRVIVGAITPCGLCRACLSGESSQCDDGGDGFRAMGGWKLGNVIDGCQAEYLRIPFAQANLAKVPEDLSDEEVLLCPDIMSTGFAASERGRVRIGDAVAVFAQGPIGLCATAGAKLSGASLVIGIDRIPARLEMAKRMGADVTLLDGEDDILGEIRKLTGNGVDVAIEALGRQETFELALRSLRPGGTLSSLGVYSQNLTLPVDALVAGLGDHTIVTTLCPGGKERMRRLMNVVREKRFPFRELVTHTFPLAKIEEAYELFASGQDGVLKIAVKP